MNTDRTEGLKGKWIKGEGKHSGPFPFYSCVYLRCICGFISVLSIYFMLAGQALKVHVKLRRH